MPKTEYTISEFARLVGCSRQNISAIAKKGELLIKNKDGLIDITNVINHNYIQTRELETIESIKPEIIKTKPVRRQVKTKNKTNPTSSKKNDEPEPEKTELQILAERALKAKHRKEIAQAEKAEIDLRKARAELAEIDTIGKVCIGYCIALNQNLLDQPRGFIDELSAGIKAGKSKTDLTDMARKPAMIAISESIEMIKKEIAKYKRDIKSDKI